MTTVVSMYTITEAGLSYIFVQVESQEDAQEHEDGEGHTHGEPKLVFQKIEINAGATDIGFTEVVPAQNIPRDPVIVTKGAYYLLAEMGKNERGHQH